MVASVKIAATSNADFVRGFVVKVGDDPLDLTGSRLRMMIRRVAADAEVYISLDTLDDDGLTITDADDGKFTMTIPRAELARMPPGTYEHDLIRIRPDGLYELVWQGTIEHKIGVTR